MFVNINYIKNNDGINLSSFLDPCLSGPTKPNSVPLLRQTVYPHTQCVYYIKIVVIILNNKVMIALIISDCQDVKDLSPLTLSGVYNVFPVTRVEHLLMASE